MTTRRQASATRSSARVASALSEKASKAKDKAVATGVKVRAKAKLFYNGARVQIGDVFTLNAPQEFNAKLMEHVDGKGQAAESGTKPAKPAESSSSTGAAGVLGE